jgi:hypothetical protein
MENKKILDELKDRKPYKVPEGYFDDFSNNLMNQLSGETKDQPKKISLFERVKPLLYIAAVFAGILMFYFFFNKTQDPTPQGNYMIVNHNSVSAETEEDFFNYLEEMYKDKYAYYYLDNLENY